MNIAAGMKHNRYNTNNNNNNDSENLAEVNMSALVQQFKKLGTGIGNKSSPGYLFTESLENLPVRPLNSPPDSPSVPYRNLFPKPLRSFGSLPLAAMGASPPSSKKYKASASEGNLKERRSRRRRGNRRSRRNRTSRR